MSESTTTAEAGTETAVIQESLLNRVLDVPCPSCAGKLAYDADKQKVSCKYCGYVEDIDKANDRIQELSLSEAVDKAPKFNAAQQEKHIYNCKGCGSKTMVDLAEVQVKCSFCGSKNVNEEAFEQNIIQPAGVIPFVTSEEKSHEIFKKWIGEGFFTPNKLKSNASLNTLKGIYIPFWTYDTETESHWSGYAGKYYYETRTRTVNGKTETYQERLTNWYWREGDHRKAFDDILISASKGAPQSEVKKVYPFNLKEVVNFSPKVLLGWQAEIYNVDVKQGYAEAEKIMDEVIRDECSKLLQMDTYKDLNVFTQKYGQTFKHIILPLWISSYEYNGKQFKLMINGQTGKIDGSKPVSVWKVIGVVLAVVAVAVGGYFIYMKVKGG